MRELARLYAAFFRVGLFTFGGGYAMLPMLQKEIVDARGWATEEELVDYFAIGQCTPGVIAVNTATFVGSRRKGIAGGAAATLGVISPSLIIIIAIAAFFTNFQDLAIVGHAFAGIRAAVTVMIGVSVYRIAKKALIDVPTVVIAAVVLALDLFADISPAVLVVAAGIAGVLLKFREGGEKK